MNPRNDSPDSRYQPVFNLPGVILGLIAGCVLIHLIRVYIISPQLDLGLLLRTAFIPARYSGEYSLDIFAFTSPVTYSFLHGSGAHLAINLVWLAAFATPLANRIGAVRFLAFWAITAILSVAMHYLFHPDGFSPVIGASGVISACMAAAARFGFYTDRAGRRRAFSGPILPMRDIFRIRTVLVFLIVWFAINLLVGLVGIGSSDMQQVAWEAHIGGFLGGFFLVGLFDPYGGYPKPGFHELE